MDNILNSIFLLKDRVSIDTYLGILRQLNYNDESIIKNGVHKGSGSLIVNVEINWETLVPIGHFKINPFISEHFQNPVPLESHFNSNLLKRQTLSFYSKTSADIFFDLFKLHLGWDVSQLPSGGSAAKSKDGKHVAFLRKRSNEDEFSIYEGTVMLNYY